MSYFAPYIDESGFHIPLYIDVRDDLIAKYKEIYGDNVYLDEDSADYQFISIFARKIFDSYQTAQTVYNNSYLNTAVGVSLDNLVSLAGITRKPATQSKVLLTITGDASTVITNGVASDGTHNWTLDETEVTIPDGGVINVYATCDDGGAIEALPNTITTIATPTYGWLSVTNNYAAQRGTNEETDGELRERFSASHQLSSQSMLGSITGALESINGVSKVVIYENATGSTSDGSTPPNVPSGIPAHSIAAIVDGGDDQEVASTIYNKKSLGCGTYGTTQVTFYDALEQSYTVNFFRPTKTSVRVKITISELPGYSESLANEMKQITMDYFDSLNSGDSVYLNYLSALVGAPAYSSGSPTYTISSVELSVDDGTTWVSTDLTPDFYQLYKTYTSYVQVVSEE